MPCPNRWPLGIFGAISAVLKSIDFVEIKKAGRLNMPIKWIENPTEDQINDAYRAMGSGSMTVARRSKPKPKDPDKSEDEVEA